MINLYNDDCFNILPNIPDKSVDMICCDLPYGTTACKWDSVLPFDKLWEQYERIIKDDGAIVLFGQEPFSSALRMSNIQLYKYDWIWEKQRPSNFQLMNYQCGRVTENIMVFSKGYACYVKGKTNMKYNPQLLAREKVRKVKNLHIYGDTDSNILHNYNGKHIDKEYSYKQPTNILRFNTVEKDKKHPTQKPVELLEYLVKTYTNEGDLVLDNCMGSGSCGVACVNLNRSFIGIEKEAKYFEIAKERIDNPTINRRESY